MDPDAIMMTRTLFLAGLLTLPWSAGVSQSLRGKYGLTGTLGSADAIGMTLVVKDGVRLGAAVTFSSGSTSTASGSGVAKELESSFGVQLSLLHDLLAYEHGSTWVGGAVKLTSNSRTMTPVLGPVTELNGSGVHLIASYGADYWFSSTFSVSGWAGVRYSRSVEGRAPKITESRVSSDFGAGITWWLN